MNFTGTTFSGNEAGRGGAIYNEGTVNINGATFATATDTIYNAGELNFSGNVDMSATTLTTKKYFGNKGTLTIGTIDQVCTGAMNDAYAIFNGDGATLNLNGGQISFDNRYGTGYGAIRNHYATSVANIGSVLIANNWDDELGAYQEYFLVVYYTNDGLNSGAGGYFDDEGIVVYHVNASLYKEVIGEDTYYDVYNNNTDPSDPDYGTEDNLIELVSAGYGSYVYGVGDSLSSGVTTSQGDKIAYTFTVDALTDSSATLTFQKNK